MRRASPLLQVQEGRRKIPESILMATLASLCPPSIEAHVRFNHSRPKTYEQLRLEVLMLLETNIGASLPAPEAAAGGDPWT
eukprot:651054-Amphidinium_carterae.3